MINKSKGEFVCTCEECGHHEFGGVEDNFLKFVEELKKDGWKMRKEDDTWTHTCPECAS